MDALLLEPSRISKVASRLIRYSLVNLGKFGSFPASLLLGLHFDITYEIYVDTSAPAPSAILAKHGARAETAAQTAGRIMTDRGEGPSAFGQAKGKKAAKKGKEREAIAGGLYKGNPGWRNLLRPLKRSDVVDAVVGEYAITKCRRMY